MCRPGYDIRMGTPNIHEFMEQFKTEQDALNFITEHIFPDGEIVCPYCGCTKYLYQKKSRIAGYECGHCRRTFTITSGTMFEYTLTPYKTWLYIMYSLFVSRLSISNYQLVRETHLTDETVYRIRRRIQAAMNNYDFEPFKGVIQIDEAFVGGSNHGRYSKEGENAKEKKYPIIGIYNQDTKRVYCYPATPNEKGQYLTKDQLKAFIEATCEPGSTIVSDEFRSYRFLDKPDSGYIHKTVDHSIGQRLTDDCYTTNGIESYWSIVKKMYYSTHSNLPKNWMHLYTAEADFRYQHNDYKEAIDTMLNQSVFFPRVIDIRKMGRFANKTYRLKDYRMILPECFDNVKLEDIKVEDVLLCEEPVYGILKTPYYSMAKRGKYPHDIYPKDWKALGLKPGGNGYKDYRKNKVKNTIEDIETMIKEATKYKTVNNYQQSNIKKPRKKKSNAKYRRQYRIKKKYNELPAILQTQIKLEYPNIMMISARDKTWEVHQRMRVLLNWYDRNSNFLGTSII